MTNPDTRNTALNVLESVLDRKQNLDLSMESDTSFAELDPRDKSFTRMLVCTVLRRLFQIDDIIRKLENNPKKAPPAMVKNILRIGVAQIMFMNVPDHAAVDTCVSLTEHRGFSNIKGFVNGMLRKLASSKSQYSSNDMNMWNAVPRWLFRSWEKDYGTETAKHIAIASLCEAPIDITVKNHSDRSAVNIWAEKLAADIIAGNSLRKTSGGRIESLNGYEQGEWWVQDFSASIPVNLFGSDIKGKTVIDLCAAPGGKTAQLVAMGADVIAVDRSKNRLKRLETNLGRLGFAEKVHIETADAGVWSPADLNNKYSEEKITKAEFILLDAPCSATGTIRRNPDIMHLKSPDDVIRMSKLQTSLLKQALSYLSKNGVLLYCTCSLQKDEGERVISTFLDENPQASRVPITADEIFGLSDAITPDGEVRILPSMMSTKGGVDGFFISRLTIR